MSEFNDGMLKAIFSGLGFLEINNPVFTELRVDETIHNEILIRDSFEFNFEETYARADKMRGFLESPLLKDTLRYLPINSELKKSYGVVFYGLIKMVPVRVSITYDGKEQGHRVSVECCLHDSIRAAAEKYQENMKRRLKRMSMSHDALIRILNPGKDKATKLVFEGQPDDVYIQHIYVDQVTQSLGVVLCSAEYPKVPEGEIIPQLEPVYRVVEIK